MSHGIEDGLTGLATRRSLLARIQVLTDSWLPDAPRPVLIMLDLDRFKLINDSLGPSICDKLLRKIAQRIKSVTPEADMIARVSGDGFAVLLNSSTEALPVAERLLDYLGRPFAIGGHAITLSASAGCATAGDHGDGAIGLLHAADLAMHRAQFDGRNRVRHFDPSMLSLAVNRHSLEADLRSAMALQEIELRRALVSKQFEVHYQPKVSLLNHHLTGFEALLRWRHPERGMVPPDRFIPLAEEIGLIDLLGDWVLRTACREAMLWTVPDGCKRPQIAVNVSPVQLRNGPLLISGIKRALAESGLPADRLEIELTETAMADDIAATLGSIRDLGIDLSLDDFGTGYSSLARLRKLPFSKLKIDRSFVLDLGNDRNEDGAGEWMIRAIASLGIGLGLTTIVEGIETTAQAEIARRVGCIEMQGYLVSRPVATDSVNKLISQIYQTRNRDIQQ